jgi:hypothetical protein
MPINEYLSSDGEGIKVKVKYPDCRPVYPERLFVPSKKFSIILV